jgi:hypothetical protein
MLSLREIERLSVLMFWQDQFNRPPLSWHYSFGVGGTAQICRARVFPSFFAVIMVMESCKQNGIYALLRFEFRNVRQD